MVDDLVALYGDRSALVATSTYSHLLFSIRSPRHSVSFAFGFPQSCP